MAKQDESETGIGFALTHQVLTNASRRQQDMKDPDARYTPVRKAGTGPWIDKLCRNWPDPSRVPVATATSPGIARVHEVCDAAHGVETPFGKRWGGDSFALEDKRFKDLCGAASSKFLVPMVGSGYCRHIRFLKERCQ